MVRLLIWAVLAIIILRLLWRMLQGVFEGLGYRPPAAKRGSVGLVRDPVCGMFVVPSQALTSGTGSNTRYFCSERCRQDYAKHG
jgi:YHS domain-containing protein